jgi:hypothetical protein
MADEETPGQRLEATLEMWEDGIAIMRANLRRRMPSATEDEIDAALDTWLCDRPPDADGVPVPWPKHR